MQNNHPMSEDAEPPSTGSVRSDVKSYRSTNNPIVHEFTHGRNSISKIPPFRKNQLGRKDSLSSLFAPIGYRANEIYSTERNGLFDEDDEQPPSAFLSIESETSGVTGPIRRRVSPVEMGGVPPCLQRANAPITISTRNSFFERSSFGYAQAGSMRTLAALYRRPSFVSWFRSVPMGRLSPPGIMVP